MRLIDADVLSQKWQNVLDQKANEKDSIVHYIFELFMNRLKYEPTIEAEPVVRCGDCVNNFLISTKTKKMVWCRKFRCEVRPDGFCSYGERREK